jgi:predicted RNA-binding Zn ribbon-like protein
MTIKEEEATRIVPEALRFVEACLNTRFGRARADEWGDAEQMRVWLVQRGLLTEGQGVTQSDYHRLLEVRAGMRGLLHGHNEGAMDAKDTKDAEGSVEPRYIETLNHIARRAPLLVAFQQDGRAVLTSELDGVDGVIGALFVGVLAAMADGSWARLKVCRNDRCQKVFYDVSKNRSGTWCLMARCGSRAKVRAYQQRRQKQMVEDGESD